jgi:F-type H+-transporting ATPase subunit gamma
MAKTQDLRRRIRSIKNTMQLTKAMKTVSAAKLRRAQEAMVAARPYAHQMQTVLKSLAARANPEEHPLLARRDGGPIRGVVITSDRGLCGSFNVNISRKGMAYYEQHRDKDLELLTVGRKGREYFKRRNVRLGRDWPDVLRTVSYTTAVDIAQYLIDGYVKEEMDAVYLVYNEFKSAMAQKPVVQQILPIEQLDLENADGDDYIYEPDARTLFENLLPKYVEFQVFHALLESVAAEHAARMTAMAAATRNAGELIDRLTLHMNRVRQAAITTEIIEVVSGAAALG